MSSSDPSADPEHPATQLPPEQAPDGAADRESDEEEDVGTLDAFLGLPDVSTSHAVAPRAGKAPVWRKITRADGLVAPLRLLCELAAEPHLTPGLLRKLRDGVQIVVVVVVPSPSWVEPVSAVVAGQGGHRAVRIKRTARPKVTALTKPDEDLNGLLLDRGSIVAVTPEPAWIAPALLGAADHLITIAPLDAKLVSRAIAIWCGRRLGKAVDDTMLAGLDLPDVAATLRAGATPAACLARLARASLSRVGLPTSDTTPPLDQLTGYGEAHVWATQLVADIARVRCGTMKASLLEGAVLYGIPGTGKTTLARAIALAARVPFCSTSVGEWFANSPGHLDGVIKAAGSFFDALTVAARSSGTAIGFIDELDALPNRARLSDRNADWWLPVITNCLLRIEDLRRAGIVLLAATNHLDRIDAALLRPGRFDRAFEIGPPDEAGRLGILRVHLGTDLVGADLTPLARLSHGMTGAVIAGAVRAARRKAEVAGRPLALDDLMTEIAPDDRRGLKELRAVALHEAAHALVAFRLGHEVVQVGIQAGDGFGGSTSLRHPRVVPDRAGLERQAVALLAGRAADLAMGGGANAGASQDLREATLILAAVHATLGLGDSLTAVVGRDEVGIRLREDPRLAERVEVDLRRLQREALLLVQANRPAIAALVEALLGRRVLTGDEVAAIAAAHPPRLRVRARSLRETAAVRAGNTAA